MATFIEDPLAIQQQTLANLQDHLDICTRAGFQTVGNAAGNGGYDLIHGQSERGWLDLTGENVPPARLPEGYVFISLSSPVSTSRCLKLG
jgi:iron transport multicopper oxidase